MLVAAMGQNMSKFLGKYLQDAGWNNVPLCLLRMAYWIRMADECTHTKYDSYEEKWLKSVALSFNPWANPYMAIFVISFSMVTTCSKLLMR